MWCVRWPSAATASGSRCAGPTLPSICSRLGRVGQIHAVQANLRHPGSVDAAVRDADAVVNLVGILFERGRQRFDTVQAFGAEACALSAAAHGARLVHVSAIGADEQSPSHYARSKAAGEKLVRAAVPGATILRPSIVFGPEDAFFNRFAAIARLAPALPLIGGGHTRLQPVFAGDVAAAVVAAIEGRATAGATYELGGPAVRTFKELMQFLLDYDRATATVAADPVRAGKAAGLLPAVPAEPLADARSGRAAATATTSSRTRPSRSGARSTALASRRP